MEVGDALALARGWLTSIYQVPSEDRPARSVEGCAVVCGTTLSVVLSALLAWVWTKSATRLLFSSVEFY